LLTTDQGAQWRQKRNLNPVKSNLKHLEFAKNLFLTWDEHSKGVIKAESILQPLTSLGLSESSDTPDHIRKFLKTLVCAIASKPDSFEIEDLRIDLLTFLKMFKTDNVSKTIAEIVKKEA